MRGNYSQNYHFAIIKRINAAIPNLNLGLNKNSLAYHPHHRQMTIHRKTKQIRRERRRVMMKRLILYV